MVPLSSERVAIFPRNPSGDNHLVVNLSRLISVPPSTYIVMGLGVANWASGKQQRDN